VKGGMTCSGMSTEFRENPLVSYSEPHGHGGTTPQGRGRKSGLPTCAGSSWGHFRNVRCLCNFPYSI